MRSWAQTRRQRRRHLQHGHRPWAGCTAPARTPPPWIGGAPTGAPWVPCRPPSQPHGAGVGPTSPRGGRPRSRRSRGCGPGGRPEIGRSALVGHDPEDACPDNCAVRPDGSAVLFDFEGGGIRHALLDAAYLVTTFPTCWCTGDLPSRARRAGLDAYRAAANWPFADFDQHLAAAAAFHALWVLDSFRWTDALGDGGGSGWHWSEVGFDVPSARGIVSLAVDDLERAVRNDEALGALGSLARSLRGSLTTRWGRWECAPPHPAFSGERAT